MFDMLHSQSKVFYEEAISVMRTGRDYDTSFALLEKAVFLTGEDSRRGGEFKLWAVSALQGVGRNKQAVELLRTLKTHRDLDVRKVSATKNDQLISPVVSRAIKT